MANGKHLGKIAKASFGVDSDGHLGLTMELRTEGGSVTDFWGLRIFEQIRDDEMTDNVQAAMAGALGRIGELLVVSERRTVDKLVGTPIEAEFKDNMLKSWRVLTEVL